MIVVEIAGAVALLIWGLRMVRNGVTSAYGPVIKRLAKESEGKRIAPFLAGMIAAMALQSGTATALIAASFCAKRVITAFTAFLIVIGADLGTALVAVIASQKIAAISPAMIAIGIFGFLKSDSSKARGLFRAIGGVGLVLLALSLVTVAAARVTGSAQGWTVIQLLLEAPLLAILAGLVLTYLAHSSLAIVLLSVSLLSSGAIGVAASVYIVLGANIGSALLPYLSHLTSENEVKAPLVANLALRVLSALVLFFTWELITVPPELSTVGIPLAVHVLLNGMVALIGLVLARIVLVWVKFLLPPDQIETDDVYPRYLDESALAASASAPVKALACAKREALVMAEIAQEMVERSSEALVEGGDAQRHKVAKLDDDLDRLFDAIKLYVAGILRRELDEDETRRAMDVLTFTANMEHIGDIVDGNLMGHVGRKKKSDTDFSPQGQEEILRFFDAVLENFQLAVNTFLTDDRDLARQLHQAKANVRKLEQKSIATHMERLGSGVSRSVRTSSLHIDVIRDLKRINSHLTAIAYPVLLASGEVPKTKWKRRASRD